MIYIQLLIDRFNEWVRKSKKRAHLALNLPVFLGGLFVFFSNRIPAVVLDPLIVFLVICAFVYLPFALVAMKSLRDN